VATVLAFLNVCLAVVCTCDAPLTSARFDLVALADHSGISRTEALLMVERNTQNVSGLWTSPITTLRRQDKCAPSGECRETHTLLGVLERANLHMARDPTE
jgi:hypothetical protein